MKKNVFLAIVLLSSIWLTSCSPRMMEAFSRGATEGIIQGVNHTVVRAEERMLLSDRCYIDNTTGYAYSMYQYYNNGIVRYSYMGGSGYVDCDINNNNRYSVHMLSPYEMMARVNAVCYRITPRSRYRF